MIPPIVIPFLIIAVLAVVLWPVAIPVAIAVWWDGYAKDKGWIKPDPEELWLLEKNRYRGK
jgi:hypothetical protein